MRFAEDVAVAERAVRVAEGGFAFAFREGALVRALRDGDWVLLDEINLAPSEVRILPLKRCEAGRQAYGISGLTAPYCIVDS